MTIHDRLYTIPPTQRKGPSLQEVSLEMRQLAELHPDTTELVSIGTTDEGREIQALRISQGVVGDTSQKPGVLFTESQYPSDRSENATLKLAHSLLESQDEKTKKLLNEQEIWMIPVVNPDGYEWRQSDSFWKKNRAPGKEGSQSHGVDLNRNYYAEDFLMAQPAPEIRRPVLDFAISHKNIHTMMHTPDSSELLR